jgi:CO/xanthine dehydrogenase FAD-binding subunit
MNGVERYVAPTDLAQALAALGDEGGAIVLAGGTDVMPQGNAGRLRPARTLLNIRRVTGLDAVELVGDALRIGALVTLTTLLTHPLVREHAALLADAADHFASDQIRNMATLGGNLCNASPAGDTLPPLLALDAEVELASLAEGGTVQRRWLALDGFFTGPGRTLREANELLTAVRIPLASHGRVARFYKTGTRPALDISTISLAFAAQREGDGRLHGVRLAIGAVAPIPLRARRTEALLEGKRLDAALAAEAAACAADEARPIDDVRATAWYRKELVRNMTQRMLGDVSDH